MKLLENTNSIELPGNRLGKKGGAAILDSLSDKVRNIDISNNKIGNAGLSNLVSWIEHMGSRC